MNTFELANTSEPTLIPTFISELNGESQPLVNARDLHAFLEIGRNVNTWLSTRIEDYQFLENIDFIRFPISESGQNKGLTGFFGGHNKIDYHLSLDMAKELSMVERNDKGRQARRYFIQCERRLLERTQANPLIQIAQNMATLADGIKASLQKLDHTERYINLLELNQKGHIKITPEVAKTVKEYKAQGYTQASIARLLRISPASVSLIVNDKYEFSELPSDEHVNRLLATAQDVVSHHGKTHTKEV